MLFFPSTGGRPVSVPSLLSKTEPWTSPKSGLLVPASLVRCSHSPVAVFILLPVRCGVFQAGRGVGPAVTWPPTAPPAATRWKYTQYIGHQSNLPSFLPFFFYLFICMFCSYKSFSQKLKSKERMMNIFNAFLLQTVQSGNVLQTIQKYT